jgi:hypothetical protein
MTPEQGALLRKAHDSVRGARLLTEQRARAEQFLALAERLPGSLPPIREEKSV